MHALWTAYYGCVARQFLLRRPPNARERAKTKRAALWSSRPISPPCVLRRSVRTCVLFGRDAGGHGGRVLRLRCRRLHRAHPRLPQEGVPLLLCAVEGVLVDVAADARDPAVGLILPEMPGARALLHGRMVFGLSIGVETDPQIGVQKGPLSW